MSQARAPNPAVPYTMQFARIGVLAGIRTVAIAIDTASHVASTGLLARAYLPQPSLASQTTTDRHRPRRG